MDKRWDVVVVGGGQAGLAMGHRITQQETDFVILDGAPAVGHAWRNRWDSLTLFTPGQYSALPGLSFPGDPDHLPRKDEVADYLKSYADTFQLPVRTNTWATSLHSAEGGFAIETTGGRYEAAQVVIATRPFQRPWKPDAAAGLSRNVVQLHSSEYRNPSQLPPGEVLVVGGGNSGVQIAAELSQAHRVALSVGARMPYLPERLLGRSIFWWLEKAQIFRVTIDSRLGRKLSRTDTLIGTSLRQLKRSNGVEVVGRVVEANGDTLTTHEGERFRPASVIWATGFHPDYRWVQPPVISSEGWPIQARGVTPLPGLYFLGLPWMHARGSALIGWVGRDADFLSEMILRHAAATSRNAARAVVPG